MHRTRKSPFIRYFDKTPPGIVCPHFFILAHANGCPYDCSYCYLTLTFRQKKCEAFTNLADMEREVACWIENTQTPSVLNAGELADSVAVDFAWFAPIYGLFAKQTRHVLLLLTKSTASELERWEPNPSVIVGFSVNAADVSAQYERGAPPSMERLAAAERLKRRGWRVRLRLEPMLPAPNWQTAYQPALQRIGEIGPERLTVGSLRYFPALRRRHKGFPLIRVERDGADGRMRVTRSLRLEMYQFVRSHLPFPFGLCKETADLHATFNPLPHCNCTI